MSQIRVMFTGQGPSGLPEDRVNNVFHFVGLLGAPTDGPDALLAVADFYNGVNGTKSIGEYLSPWVSRNATLTWYDLEEAVPRVPHSSPLVLGATGSFGAPEEVAVCLSFAGATPPGANPRRRGRLFIGPLDLNAAVQPGTTVNPSRPNPTFTSDLRVAAVRLLAHVEHPVIWSIHSRVPTSNMVAVASGWIDDALDTQRRRGPKSTSRVVWPPAA